MDPFDETSTQSPCDGCKVMTDNSDLQEFERKHYCPDCKARLETEARKAKEFMALYQERSVINQRARWAKYNDIKLYISLRDKAKELTKKLKAYVVPAEDTDQTPGK